MNFRRHESREYTAFVESSGVTPPPAIDRAVRETIGAKLQPSFGRVFSKLSVTHVVASAVTLSVCPQFQFRLVGEGHGLMELFMDAFGPLGCTIACGVFFMGVSAALATAVLNREEARSLRGRTLPAVLALLLPSLGFFALAGAMSGALSPTDFVQTDTLVWLLGGLAGGWTTLSAGLGLRLRSLSAG